MSKTQDLFHLLVQREGQWVRRDDLNFLGGEDTGRRMREVAENVAKSNQYRLDERVDEHRRLEYRLVKLAIDNPEQRERYRWVCAKCDSHPVSLQTVVASLNPQYRVGPCGPCRTKQSVYKRLAA